jgi:hypothetical protein
LQLGVFGFSGDEDGDVGVGIFPGGEEILVREASFAGVALKGPRPPELKLSERIQIAERSEATVVENRLERGGGPWIFSSAARASRIPLLTLDSIRKFNRVKPIRYRSELPAAPSNADPGPSGRLAGSGTKGVKGLHCWSVRSRLWHIPVLMP